MKLPIRSAVLASAAALVWTAAASAQSGAPSTVQSGLEDIVVTATRREERLQDIPVTVSAITSNALKGAGIGGVRELTQMVPGFVGSRNTSSNQPVIRGVGSSGLSVGDESNVATYIDGVYQADPFSTSLDLVEVERVEVLRGPQGTVFGRNATGGLINVITPDPSFDARGRVSARFGRMRNDANDYDFRGYLTGPINDVAAADIAALYRKNDGYVKDLVRGGGLADQEMVNVRSKLMVKPDDGTKIILTGEYAKQNGSFGAFQPLDGNSLGRRYPGYIAPTGPWQSAVNTVPVLDYERIGLSLRTRFDLGAADLETTTGYTHTKIHHVAESDGSNILLGEIPLTSKTDVLTQEVRLLSTTGGRFNWLVGAYAFNLNGDMDIDVQSGTGPGTPVTHLYLRPHVETTSFAGFAEGTYELVPALFVTGGVRYTTEKRSFSQVLNGVMVGGHGVERTYNKWNYRGAIRYNFAEKANVFVSYGTGFKSGVYNALGPSLVPTDPETIESWEGGIKADPLPWLRTNLSIYHYSYDDLQVQAKAPAGSNYVLQNAANAKIYGGELEVTVSPVQELNLRGAFAYTHGEYDNFPGAQTFVPQPGGGNVAVAQDVSGNRIIRTPRTSFNLGIDWSRELAGGRFGLTANAYHSARVYYDFLNLASQDPYWMVNGEVSWSTPDDKWTFSVWAKNITNEVVAQQILPGAYGTEVVYEMPRRIGVGAAFKF